MPMVCEELYIKHAYYVSGAYIKCILLLFSCQVMSDSLQPHQLQHARLLSPSLSPWVCSNYCPLSQWCHPTLSSVAPFSSCSQFPPLSGSFPVNQLLTSGGQSSIRWSFTFSISPSNDYSGLIAFRTDWFYLLPNYCMPSTLHKSGSLCASCCKWSMPTVYWMLFRRQPTQCLALCIKHPCYVPSTLC